jgi:hypothetical protein
MGSHCPFGHLKHKLWPKEGPKVKLAIWFPTTKSRESTQFRCMQVAWDMSLESFRWRLQLFFRLHLNPRSTHKVMGPQSRKSPNFGNFGTPTWVPGQKAIWMWAPWVGMKYTIRGEGDGFPQAQAVVSFVSPSCMWLVLTPKVLQQCTNQLVAWFCAGPYEWISAYQSS